MSSFLVHQISENRFQVVIGTLHTFDSEALVEHQLLDAIVEQLGGCAFYFQKLVSKRKAQAQNASNIEKFRRQLPRIRTLDSDAVGMLIN